VLPIVALLPDISYMLIQKIFFPSPTDAVMLMQKKQPSFVFDGFSEVFIPQLPHDVAMTENFFDKNGPKKMASPDANVVMPLNGNDESQLYASNQNVRSTQGKGKGKGKSHTSNALRHLRSSNEDRLEDISD
jgi:hypothetical protein